MAAVDHTAFPKVCPTALPAIGKPLFSVTRNGVNYLNLLKKQDYSLCPEWPFSRRQFWNYSYGPVYHHIRNRPLEGRGRSASSRCSRPDKRRAAVLMQSCVQRAILG